MGGNDEGHIVQVSLLHRPRQSYLHEKAIMMEKKAMSRTYVAIENNMHVVGYFSEE